jgi:hypothetical protein
VHEGERHNDVHAATSQASTIDDAASPKTPRHGWAWYTWVALIALGSAMSSLRPFPTDQRFTMGIEDGAIFTDQARILGVWRSFFTTYAGYLHFLPRCVAAIASGLPLAWSPVIYYSSAALVAGAAAAIAMRCARGMGLSALSSILVAAAVLILPAAGWEVPGELTNVEWPIIAVFVVFIISWIGGYQPRSRWAMALLVVAGLTSPLLVVSLPVIAIVAFRRRTRLDLAVLVTVVVTALVQFGARLGSSNVRGSGHWSVIEIVRDFAVRVVIGGTVGARYVPHTWAALGEAGSFLVAAIIAATVVVVGLTSRDRSRTILAYALYASVAYLVVAIVVRPKFFTPTLPIGQVVIDGRVELWDGRYMAASATALIVAAVYYGEQFLKRSGPIRATVIVAAVLYAGVLAANFPVDVHHDTYAHWQAQVHSQQRACDLEHGKGDVVIAYGIPTNAPAWKIHLSCQQAFGPTPNSG